MKQVQRNALVRSVRLLLCLLFPALSFAQIGTLTERPNVAINANVNGYLEYLPLNYDPAGSTRHPLLLVISGLGSQGNGSDAALDALWTCAEMPHEQQQPRNCAATPWVDQYTVGGNNHRFVIITPQFQRSLDVNPPTSAEINSLIDYAIQNYRVDTTRIYMIGTSQGGGVVWTYTSESSRNANRIAAFATFGAVVIPSQERANVLKYANTRVWGVHFADDPVVPPSFTSDFVDFYNNPPAPAIPARKTMVPGTAHVVWPGFLNRTNVGPDGLNVYQWLLQYQRTHTRVFAGEDQEIALPTNSVQLNGQGTGPNGTTTATTWTKIYGGNYAISNANIDNPTLTNLEYGVYIFRLTKTDNTGATSSDDVAITVNPAATRYQAENFIAYSGDMVLNDPTSDPDVPNDPDGGRRVNNINGYNGADYLDYTVNVPVSGNYRIRFRTGSNYGAAAFEIRNVANNQVLGSVRMYQSGYDDYRNTYATIPLVAGANTIRIIHTGLAGTQPWDQVWYMNWFEIIDNPGIALGPLPVRFSVFHVNCTGGRADLSWKTAFEQNTARFVIQRSANGRDWTEAGSLPARGGNDQSYQFTDATAAGWYRIMAEDQDGRKTFTDVLRSNCGRSAQVSVYPNPVRDIANVSFVSETATTARITVVDAKGQTVRQQSISLPRGSTNVSVDLSGVASGTYTLVADWGGQKQSVKLIKR